MMNALYVYTEVKGELLAAGTAYFKNRRSLISTSFKYDLEYLKNRKAYAIDPYMPLTQTSHHSDGLFGTFSDSIPDRWGRNLIDRKINNLFAKEKDAAPSINEIDYLAGVPDLTRQGSLRFKIDPTGPFIEPHLSVSNILALPKLLRASERTLRDGKDMDAIKELLDAGSSALGGARPKAPVKDNGKLLIAKFPHAKDKWNVMAWEKTALDMAKLAGINVASSRLERFGEKSVLLLERFDRKEEQRIAYASGLTLIQGTEGGGYDYLDLAEAIHNHGSNVKSDLFELWKRIAFSIMINNTDDHLRNYGFLYSHSGWALSPSFDLNPNPDTNTMRVTSVLGASSTQEEFSNLMILGDDFEITQEEKLITLDSINKAVLQWKKIATENQVTESEQKDFEKMFTIKQEIFSDFLKA